MPQDIKTEARELIDRFLPFCRPEFFDDSFAKRHENTIEHAKECAILHCELMLEYERKIYDMLAELGIGVDDTHYTSLIQTIKTL